MKVTNSTKWQVMQSNVYRSLEIADFAAEERHSGHPDAERFRLQIVNRVVFVRHRLTALPGYRDYSFQAGRKTRRKRGCH